jgi:hypothetical protein
VHDFGKGVAPFLETSTLNCAAQARCERLL